MLLTRPAMFALALMLSAASAAAQPRDAVLNEQREAAAADACADDPECAATARRVIAQQQRDEARAEAIYQARPAWQKLLGWMAIPGACWLIWHLAGRKPSKPAATDERNHTGNT